MSAYVKYANTFTGRVQALRHASARAKKNVTAYSFLPVFQLFPGRSRGYRTFRLRTFVQKLRRCRHKIAYSLHGCYNITLHRSYAYATRTPRNTFREQHHHTGWRGLLRILAAPEPGSLFLRMTLIIQLVSKQFQTLAEQPIITERRKAQPNDCALLD